MKSFPRRVVFLKVQRYFVHHLKNRSDSILRLWMDQCEYILSQRLRRGQQMLSLYTKICGDAEFRELLSRLRRHVQRHAKGIMMGAALFTFNWNEERITLESVREHFEGIDFVEELKRSTLICKKCYKRRVIDKKIDGIDYCLCGEALKRCSGDWEPYLERGSMIIWRRAQKCGKFAYKVYGEYPDVSAEDFLHVQTDLEYRREWDSTAIALELIDTDISPGSSSHVIYWEMLWPKLFANRDYVYNRRTFVDKKRQLIVIANRSTQHPKCPAKPTNQRVSDYWSYMVIKPYKSFGRPGLKFVLTYFDDPGIVMPPALTSWVARKQMPEFLNKLYNATLKYAQKRRDEEVEAINRLYSYEKLRDPGYEYPPDPEVKESKRDDKPSSSTSSGGERHSILEEADEEPAEGDQKSKSWWRFFHPYYYFA
ncbi:stAR-related lipid transfer protein 7, mitochondrial-like [Phlebotomus argentipes]|uniref:stAR-related lipid transfer protein 7, mitochondrial-like n=1 Tax=Phlebotomus argentipes TaxID=94469 RepID=UPI002892BC01|nr:stAR-related lipid transfer protein 7, mitochondrial-like [Phlebotomus argentipes]